MTNEELAVQAKAGDRAARDNLWECVRRLCCQLARRYFPLCERAGIEREDLEQELYFGFLAALDAFDPASGNRFTSYLQFHVWNAFAAALGIRNGRAMCPRPASLQIPLGDEDGGELQDMIADETSEQPFAEAENRLYCVQLRALLDDCLNGLDVRQADVIRSRYFCGHSRGQTAGRLGVSPQRVHQLEFAGMRQLRRQAHRLQAFRDGVIRTQSYHGTGLSAWRRGSSVQERTMLYLEDRGL